MFNAWDSAANLLRAVRTLTARIERLQFKNETLQQLYADDTVALRMENEQLRAEIERLRTSEESIFSDNGYLAIKLDEAEAEIKRLREELVQKALDEQKEARDG